MNTTRKLPIGIQTFEKLRNEGYLYVDKTELLYRLASLSVPNFLSRPRRFGKSLLLSTFKAYFEGKKELFEGLAITRLEKEWKTYPILYLDLNAEKYDSIERLNNILDRNLCRWEEEYNMENKETTLSGRFENIIIHIKEQTGMGVGITSAKIHRACTTPSVC